MAEYVQQWWTGPFQEETQSKSAAAVGRELLRVLTAALQLLQLCSDKNSPAVFWIILGGAGEFREIVDDVKRCVQMLNRLITRTLRFRQILSFSSAILVKQQLIEQLKYKVELDCNTLQTTLTWACEQDRETLLQSFKSEKANTIWPFKADFLGGSLRNALIDMLESKALSAIDHKDVQLQDLLGVGSFGFVRKSLWAKLPVAVKEFPSESLSFEKELEVFTKLLTHDCSHVLQILGYSHDKKWLVLELMDTNLRKLIEDKKISNALDSVDIMLQIAKGMNQLHNKDVIHRDINPRNILVNIRKDQSFHIKLADFGISKTNFLTMGAPNTTNIGTFMYMAPEMLDAKENYTRKVDVHSFGLVCSEILTGKQPFLPQDNVKELLRKDIRPCLPDSIPVTLKRMINRCWEYDGDKRPSFEEICDDLWIAKEMILVIEIDEQVLRCEIQELKFKLNETGSSLWSIPMMPRISTPTDKKAIYVFSYFSGKNYCVKNLPIDMLIDIQLVDVVVQSSGHVEFLDPWNSIQNPFLHDMGVEPQNLSDGNPPENLGLCGQFKKLLKDQGKKFNLSLAIGGWEQSRHFSDAFSTSKNRNAFVNSLVNLLAAYPVFNGIVIDWCYVSDDGINYGAEVNVVRKEDGENFILVLQQLRSALPTGFYIAATCTAKPEEANWPVERAIDLLDGLQIRTSFFHDGSYGDRVTSHHANLYSSSYGKWSADEAVKFYMGRNVPSSKIFIVGALYSRGFVNTDGIGMHTDGSLSLPPDYNALPVQGLEEKWDDEAKATYAHDPVRRIVYTYDNVRSIMEKAEYVKSNNLGGILIAHAASDFPCNHKRSVIKALHDRLTQADKGLYRSSTNIEALYDSTSTLPSFSNT